LFSGFVKKQFTLSHKTVMGDAWSEKEDSEQKDEEE